MPSDEVIALERMSDNNARALRAGMPAVIESYDPISQLANVRMVQPELTADGQLLAAPVITDVPVLWPGGAGGQLSFPLVAGDAGWISFADRDISGWVDTREIGAAPDSERMHALTDAIFQPCFRKAPVDKTAMTLTFGGNTITFLPNGTTVITPGTGGLVVNGPSVFNGDVVIPANNLSIPVGDLLFGAFSGRLHAHGGVEPGAGTTTGGAIPTT
jgi:hypothetical protein